MKITRKMHRAKVLVKNWENGECDIWKDTIWQEEWTDREKF